MQIILSHSGKQHSYQVAKAMYGLGHLDRFYTSSYVRSGQLQQFFTNSGNQYWTRRFIEGLPGSKVNANWRFEIKEMAYRKLFGKTITTQNSVYLRDQKFDTYTAKCLNKKHFDLFWGFQGSCHNTLKSAKALGKTAVCELATAHVTAAKRILGEEAKLHPEWADSIDNLIFPVEYERRLVEEPHIADKVIAASGFTKQSLLDDGIPQKNIHVLPLGFNVEQIPYKIKTDAKFGSRPLKLLYAGTVTQRKGIKYLLEAMKAFNKNDVELHIIGSVQGSGKGLDNYKGHFIHHPPISQAQLFQKYQEFDFLVLPTIFEGFGLVIVEAMAAGLPVITTSHSFGAELVEHEHNGFLTPIRDAGSIQQTIVNIQQLKPNQYAKLSVNARTTVQAYSWKHYQNRLQDTLALLS